jgi:hypothetical protein
MNTRTKTLAIGLICALSTGVVGLVVGSQLKNPNAVLPKNTARSRLLVPVASKKLRSVFVTRGSGSPTGFQNLLAANANAASFVTKAPEANDELKEGTVAYTIDDVPTFLLQGKLPIYRDMKPGDQGKDIAQLDAALARLGKLRGAADDVYDVETEAAIERLFLDAGARPIGPAKEELEALTAARNAVTDSDTAVFRAKQELTNADKPVTPDQLISAQEAVDAAKDAVERLPDEEAKTRSDAELLVRAKDRAVVEAETSVKKADADFKEAQRLSTDRAPIDAAIKLVEDAKTKAKDAAAAIADVQQSVEDAKAELAVANDTVVRLREAVEPLRRRVVPLVAEAARIRALGAAQQDGSVIFYNVDVEAAFKAADDAQREATNAVMVAETAVRNAEKDIVAKTRAITQAERNVEKAKQNADDAAKQIPIVELGIEKAKRELQNRVEQLPLDAAKPAVARDVLQAAKDDAATAKIALTKIDQTLASKRRAANSTLEVAKANFAKLRLPPDLSNIRAQIASAELTRDNLVKTRNALEAKTGFVVPQGTVVFTPDAVNRVLTVDAPAGTQVGTGTQIISLSGGYFGIDAVVEVGDRQRVKPGQQAVVEFTDVGASVNAEVKSVSSKPDKADPSVVAFRLEVGGRAATLADGTEVKPNVLIGAVAKISILLDSMRTEGLVVPLSAIVTKANRETFVMVEDSPGADLRAVAVKPAMVGDGEVEVIPANPSELKVGALVQVANPADATTDPIDAGATSGNGATITSVPGALATLPQ